jgi:hypothetical protein
MSAMGAIFRFSWLAEAEELLQALMRLVEKSNASTNGRILRKLRRFIQFTSVGS